MSVWTVLAYVSAILTHVLTVNIGQIATTHRSLEVLHVIFRHGDRTPDSLYPKDPYTSEEFFPDGVGQLTNKGKLTSYNVGLAIRKHYDGFLGDVYFPDLLHGLSSHFPRAKASLELVLAGLFPPNARQQWNQDLQWQPIPYDYLQEKENTVFMAKGACPNFPALFQDVFDHNMLNDHVYKKYEKHEKYLRKESGFEHENLLLMGRTLYSTLKSEKEYGLQLPNWTEPVYPDVLMDLSAHFWKYYTASEELKILTPGFLLSRIMENTNATLNGTIPKRKLYLYSGHESNIVSLLGMFDSFTPHNPNYGAYITIEIHKVLGIRFVKIVYENHEHALKKPIFVPRCGVLCPIETFVRLYENQLDEETLRIVCGN